MKNKADMLKLNKISRVFIVPVLFFAFIPGWVLLDAAVVRIQLPPETATFKSAPGAEMANSQCLTCHSVEYVQMQPPKPLDFWAAEVKKMREKYGAQFSKDFDPELAGYLARNYGTDTNNPAPVALAINSPAASSEPLEVEAFAKKYGCLSCHKVDAKVVGPAFKDVAAKYRNDPDALDKIKQQIHNGGSGKWGAAVMPPYKALVNDSQADMLAHWIISQGAGK
jgi:cytochrome c551/c552